MQKQENAVIVIDDSSIESVDHTSMHKSSNQKAVITREHQESAIS